MHKSTKTYGHEIGLSCAFRQWRAESHCNLIHGYALSFHFEFSANELDDRNWVIDFGSLKGLKQTLVDQFDHTVVVAHDDPQFDQFMHLNDEGLIDMRVMDQVGCEGFALWAYHAAIDHLLTLGEERRVWVSKVEVREHGANSAIYAPGWK